MTLKQVVEALVFASQKPMMPKEIVSALKSAAHDATDADALGFSKVKEVEVAAMLQQLKLEYLEAGHAFQLIEKASGWHLVTDPAAGIWVRHLYPESKPTRLSGPALETLAIIAYRQPLTRADIEAVRGVAVDGMMQTLLEKGLIRIGGRSEVPGRPLLYETTQYFLEHFGLKSVDELPNTQELRRISLPTAPKPEEKKPEEKKSDGKKSSKQAVAPEQQEPLPFEGKIEPTAPVTAPVVAPVVAPSSEIFSYSAEEESDLE